MSKFPHGILLALFCLFLSACVPSSVGEDDREVNIALPATQDDEACVSLVGGALNALYIGMRNPLEINLSGQSLEEVEITCEGADCELEIETPTRGFIKPKQAGDVKIMVDGEGGKRVFHFEALPLPSPVASFRVDRETSNGSMGSGTFKSRKRIVGTLLNYDINTTCRIESFELTRIPLGGKPVKAKNKGGEYQSEAAALVAAAQAGDVYYYTKIKGKCFTDKEGRLLPPMVWEIQ